MITMVTIKNFKSLADFSMPFDQFNCLIGLNGAGKTTVLQALDFIGHLASGETAFRDWKKKDYITNGSNLRTITFQIEILPAPDDIAKIKEQHKGFAIDRLLWFGKYNVDRQRFTEEQIVSSVYDDSPPYLSWKDNQLSYLSGKNPIEEVNNSGTTSDMHFIQRDFSDIAVNGSILSIIKSGHPLLMLVKKELQSLKSLEQLTPNVLRRVSQQNKSIGLSGEGLPGFLSSMKETDAQMLAETLQTFYPDVLRYEIKRKKFGWKDLLVRESTLKNPVPATHVNDGYLRILAMLSQKYSDASFLLFDEIENGINQELIEKLLNELQNFNGKQVLVTTHSALVLNYLTDEAAKKSVIFLYKDSDGHTHAKKFFEISEMKNKLKILGPGEAMSDTNLESLSRALSLDAEK